MRVLALDDQLAISRIASLDRNARTVLLELERPKLIDLARTLTEVELQTLARYLTGLSADASQRVLRLVAGSPARMRNLVSPRGRDAILASRNQTAAVGMMLSDTSFLDVATVARNMELVWSGDVHPILIWEKQPAIVVALGFLVLIALLMLRSLLFGGRRRKKPAPTESV